MARRERPSPLPGSRAILLLPVLAVGIGLASVLLSGALPATPPSTPTSGGGGELLNAVTFEEAGLFAVGLASVLVVFWLVQRGRGNAQSLPYQFLIGAFAIFCVALAFLAAVHLFVHGAVPPREAPGGGSPNNGTTTNSSSYLKNNSTGNVTGSFLSLPPGWPWWTPYAVLGAVALVAGGLAVPYAWSRSLPAVAPAVRTPPSARTAVRTALAALDGSKDPRTAIIALYAQLLGSVGGRVGPTETRTARELARILVDGLGVSASVASELTERFEEARYSHRPLREDAVPRTRAALRQALDELSGPSARRP